MTYTVGKWYLVKQSGCEDQIPEPHLFLGLDENYFYFLKTTTSQIWGAEYYGTEITKEHIENVLINSQYLGRRMLQLNKLCIVGPVKKPKCPQCKKERLYDSSSRS